MKPSYHSTASSITSATTSATGIASTQASGGPPVGTSDPASIAQASIDQASIVGRGWSDSDQGQSGAAVGPMLLTLNEVAVELRCARRSVERHIAADEIRTVRFGRCVRVERAELARFIAGHTERRQEADDVTSA
ncbi:MAG: helix-turn-helix domain-containing protein [Nocardioides sp.]|uniref:helix-turn-helix domain-containing protein n=1 Tax=Nocardioides sp. TaxID=35761 RepID=UPI0023A4C08E|nr:helix-turn-helix domain-containing protein [Nocardioides sp.]MDE0776288.1 helix-turn-helix domain-containing protein [Nocardioides sp.]